MRYLFQKANILICVFLAHQSHAQHAKNLQVFKNRAHIEFMIVPTLIYNSVSLGFSKMTSERTEHLLTLSGVIMPGYSSIKYSAAWRYSYNLYIKKGKRLSTYVPFWLGNRYVGVPPGEPENSAYELILCTIGSGCGLKFAFKNDNKIRVELGLGASLHTESVYGKTDFSVDEKNPVIPAFRLNIKYAIPLGKRE